MEKQLYEAALEGNVTTLTSLTQQDPLILDRVTLTSFQETPLHVATLRGHVEFARALLRHSPKLATELDSHGNSPLHLASAKGHPAIVGELLSVGPTSCLTRNKDGKLPLHLAIVKGGRIDIVRELTRACPESTELRLDKGETIFHLCAKYDNLEALQVLVAELLGESDSNDLLSARDDDGNTFLHVAALYRHFEIIKYLVKTRPGSPGLDVNEAVNNNGHTVLELIENSPKDMKNLEILNFLLQSNNAQEATNSRHITLPKDKASPKISIQGNNPRRARKSWKQFFTLTDSDHLEKIRGELLIICAIIVTIVALPIINMKVNGPVIDDEFTNATLCLVPAMTIMLIVISGFSLRNKLTVWLLVQLMYTALGFLGLYYFGSIVSNESRYFNLNVMVVLMIIWFVLLMLVSLLNVIRLVVWVVSRIKGCLKR